MLLTAFCNKLLRLRLDCSRKDFSSVFGYPNQVVPDLVMTPSGFTHLQSICIHETIIA